LYFLNVLSKTAICSITWYQTELSPRKGFCCAYRIRNNGLSCSAIVKQAFISGGLIVGVREVFVQAARCRAAATSLSNQGRDSLPDETERKKKDRFCESSCEFLEAVCCYLPLSF